MRQRINNILITGAAGNIGYELINGLHQIETGHRLVAADYSPDHAGRVLKEFPGREFRKLDFTDRKTFGTALEGIDRVFLLRPPQLADVPRYFEPFIHSMVHAGIRQVVFLSVQGAEEQKRIPHHKIEQLILKKGLDYIFLRPSYFMQNLTTTLVHEIRTRNRIFLPAGKLKFTWVDARDIGLVGAHILDEFEKYRNSSLVITGSEQLEFAEVARLLSEKLGRQIRYESPSLARFFMVKRRLGIRPAMIFVMIMLHYLPRFSRQQNNVTTRVEEITGRKPGTLEAFIERELTLFDPE